MGSSRFRITVWVAFADLFTAMSLFAFALYGVQRHKLIAIEQPVQVFASELDKALKAEGIAADYDKTLSKLTLPEAMLFKTADWHIVSPQVVEKLSRAMSQARQKADESHLARMDGFQLVIRGHADARPIQGSSNLELSRLRAEELVNQLSAHGIHAPEFHVSAEAVGSSEPIVDNCQPQTTAPRTDCPSGFASDKSLSKNRRIELRFGFFSGS